MDNSTREVAQSGSASGLGPEGRRFESCRSDHDRTTGPESARTFRKVVVEDRIRGSGDSRERPRIRQGKG